MTLQIENTNTHHIKINSLIIYWVFVAPIFCFELAKFFYIPKWLVVIIAVLYLVMLVGSEIYLHRVFDPFNKGYILHPGILKIDHQKRKDIYNNYEFLIMAGIFPTNFLKIFKLPYVYHIIAIVALLMMVSWLIYFGKFTTARNHHSDVTVSMPDRDIMIGFIGFFLLVLGIISFLLIKNAQI